MRATARGRLVLAAALALALAAPPAQSVVAAFAAVLLLGLAAAARRGLAEARVDAEVEAPRRAPAGQPFLVVARARVQPALPVRARCGLPPGARVEALDAPAGLGAAAWEAAVRVGEPGAAGFEGVRVEVTDPLGLWAREVLHPAEAMVHVLPEALFAARGGRLGPFERAALGKRAFQDTVEVERIRPYHPGDRLRDLDWAHSAKFQRLIARQRVREAPRPVVALVDATPPMRWRRSVPMGATAARAVLALAGAARAAGVPAGAVVYSEQGVLGLVRAARAREALERLARALAEMPEAVPVQAAPAASEHEAPLALGERRFLGALAPFVRGPLPGAAPLDAALAAVATVSGQPSLVAVVSCVDHAPRAAVTAAQRLLRRGHLVAVLSPSLPAHLLGPEDAATRPDLLRAAERRRAWAAQRLGRLGVPLVILRPGEELQGVAEVVAWAR